MNLTGVNRIRLGVLTFPLSGLVALLGALTPGIGINPATDPAGFAQASNLVGLVNLVGVVGLALQLYGLQALYLFLSTSSVDRWAFTAMVFSIVGLGLYLPFLGVIAIVAPVAGRAYLNGQTQAVSIISEATSLSNPAVFVVGGTSLLLFVIGSILFGFAIWRSGKITKWSAVAYTFAAPLNVVPHYIPAFWIAGAILLLAAGTGIVKGVWKNVRHS